MFVGSFKNNSNKLHVNISNILCQITTFWKENKTKFSKNNGIIIFAGLFKCWWLSSSQLRLTPVSTPHLLCTTWPVHSRLHCAPWRNEWDKYLGAVVNIVQVDRLPVGLEVKVPPTTGGKTLFRITVTCDKRHGVHVCLKTEPKHTQNGHVGAPEKSAFFFFF